MHDDVSTNNTLCNKKIGSLQVALEHETITLDQLKQLADTVKSEYEALVAVYDNTSLILNFYDYLDKLNELIKAQQK